jgi:hypothetical protein
LRDIPHALAPVLADSSRLMAVFLKRTDEVPDDVLVVPRACDLRALGISEECCWLWRHDERFCVVRENQPESLSALVDAMPGAELGSLGKVTPHAIEDLVRVAGTGE